MSTKISDLAPTVAVKAIAAIQEMQDRGISHAVTSTLRTTAEQIALYAQGRKTLEEVNALRATATMRPIVAAENLYTVTNADGVVNKSNHQSGRALDVVPVGENDQPVWPVPSDPRWGMIAGVMKDFGFRWGGDFEGTFKDLPHYET